MGVAQRVARAVALAAAVIALGALPAHAQPPAPEPSASSSASATPSAGSSASTTASTTPSTASSTSRQPFDDLDSPDPRGRFGAKVPQARPGVTLRTGQFGPSIATLQTELDWLGHRISNADSSGARFGTSTREAVRAFQVKHWLPATGKADKRTRRTIARMAAPIGILPRACTEKKMTICVDKTAKVLRLVEHGTVTMTTDARFGAPGMETGEGIFAIHEKSRDHVSSRFHTWMPFAMFFNGDEAVHYSPDFHAVGYLHGSHGCIGIRDIDTATWLFDRVPVGTRVYVYWS